MELIYTMLFCISIFFLLFKPLFHHFSKTSNLPPGPKGLPILGSIHWLGTQPHKSLSKLAKIYGPIMTLRLGSTTTVVLTSPEMAKQLLQTHSQSFSDRPIPDAIASLPNIEVSLVWGPSADTRWRKLRGICSTQLFTSQKLNSLQHLRYQKVEQLIEHVRKLCVSGSSVNIGQVFFATTLNLIFSTMFSIDIVDPEFSRAQEFKDLVWKVVETAGKPNLSDYFPVLKRFDLQGLRKHARVSYDRMHEIFDELIAKRMKARASHSTSRNGDFLDVLLDQWEENGGSVLNRETIKPLIQNLFITGSETSATTAEWAMAELLRNPEVMKKAKKELIEVIGMERSVKESDMDQLPYLQAVVKETLRLHPATPLLLPYKARNEVEISGYTIPKGTRALVNIWAINRDPKYWDQPLKFSPERFIGSKIDYRDGSFEYIPFGAGRRSCLGMPLATRMVHLMVASMILSFDWKLPQGMIPEDLDMGEQFGMTLKKASPLYAIPYCNKMP